jgi:hypothetical protein
MNMESAIHDYLDVICDNYAKSMDNPDMINQFESSIRFDVGNKYVKVIIGSMHQESVHSFIVREDGPKFKKGDILKAASWASPARNFARGNIFKDVSNASKWTGA